MKRQYDDDFIERLVAEYSDMILRIAYHHTGNLQDAEDIAQEVFLSLVDRDLPDDSDHLKAYIIRSTVNKCNSFRRAKKGEDIVYLDEIYKNENEPVFTFEERSVIHEVMRLPKRYRDVIYLHYYEGYSVAEIADILDTKTGTITSRLKRAREKLKPILQEEYDG